MLSIDDIDWYSDGYFTMPTFLQKFTSQETQTFKNPSEVSDFIGTLESYFGRDWTTIYCALITNPDSYRVGLYQSMVKLIPSIPLMCKEMNEKVYSIPPDVNWTNYPCIYIPTLKRCLIGTTNNNCFIASVNDDGTFEYGVSNINISFNGFCSETGAFLNFGPINYVSGMDLSNIENYNQISIGWSSLSANGINIYKYLGTNQYYSKIFINYLFSKETVPDVINYIAPNNPYEPGGSSGYGGGGGSFNNNSDTITIPSKPTLSSSNTGFTRIYNPTLSQVQDLASYLWTDETVIETIWNHIKQYFENPMDAMIGFNLVPVQVPNGGSESFKLMYIDTGVTMNTAANQFVDVDCGSLEIQEYYGSALDYSPYTKISCFLPFIGNVSLNVDEIMKKTISITYRVDICSGACVAYISVDGNAIYQFSGHCAISIPFSSADFTSYVNAIISTAKLATSALVAGASAMGATAVADAAQQTNQVVTTKQVTQTARNPATGRQITTGTTTIVETRESPNDQSSTQASFSGLTPQNVANTVGAIMSSKPHIEHSGSFSGNSGYLGIRRPFVIIERPNMCMPENYQQLNGFPCMITLPLSDCSGFTRVQQVQLTGVKATNPEQAELLELLKSGVIL